jgi:hypothetical protein
MIFLVGLHAQEQGFLQPGDSVVRMTVALGEPIAQIERGGVIYYSYPQGVVEVRDGRVVKLSDGFYGPLDQITVQTAEGPVELPIGSGLKIQEPPTATVGSSEAPVTDANPLPTQADPRPENEVVAHADEAGAPDEPAPGWLDGLLESLGLGAISKGSWLKVANILAGCLLAFLLIRGIARK